jgi:hypothetical protein
MDVLVGCQGVLGADAVGAPLGLKGGLLTCMEGYCGAEIIME